MNLANKDRLANVVYFICLDFENRGGKTKTYIFDDVMLLGSIVILFFEFGRSSFMEL